MAKYELLVFSLCLPFDGVDHAGGEYLLRSVRAVAPEANVTIVSVDSPRNRHALRSGRLDYTPVLIEYTGIFRSRILDFLRRVQNRVVPLTLPVGLRAALKKSPKLDSLVGAADVIEFQWIEMVCLRRHLPPGARTRRTVVVAHDVLTQRYARRRAAVGLAGRPFQTIRHRFVRSRESRLLRSADVVTTFSEKDAMLLRELAPECKVSVVFPPLHDPGMDLPRHARVGRAIFVATFARRENLDAADWLLAEIWPRVLRDVPTAELALVGTGSDVYLDKTDVGLRGGVFATGYLESLEDQYRDAAVALVPMRLGAGVKFKTLTAMLWGIPVVATPVGAEGIGSSALYVDVTADPVEFARSVRDVLSDPGAHQERAETARVWARELAGPERFRASIRATHGGDAE